ncbi:MAG: hypothetical protein HRT35_19210, partial [Algicola sp.]|nr:hypothetical protein [Algicola sp.]
MIYFKFVGLFLVLLLAGLLAGCQSALETTPQTTAPLQLESISVDDDGRQNINQIVFRFNQAVAIPGAVPSAAQVGTITIQNAQSPNCRWRFIDSQRLACELKTPLNPASVYFIKVKAFPGFDGAKSNTLSKTIKTPFPTFGLSNNYTQANPLSDAHLDLPDNATFDQHRFEQYLKVKTPTGDYLPLSVSQTKTAWGAKMYPL